MRRDNGHTAVSVERGKRRKGGTGTAGAAGVWCGVVWWAVGGGLVGWWGGGKLRAGGRVVEVGSERRAKKCNLEKLQGPGRCGPSRRAQACVYGRRRAPESRREQFRHAAE